MGVPLAHSLVSTTAKHAWISLLVSLLMQSQLSPIPLTINTSEQTLVQRIVQPANSFMPVFFTYVKHAVFSARNVSILPNSARIQQPAILISSSLLITAVAWQHVLTVTTPILAQLPAQNAHKVALFVREERAHPVRLARLIWPQLLIKIISKGSASTNVSMPVILDSMKTLSTICANTVTTLAVSVSTQVRTAQAVETYQVLLTSSTTQQTKTSVISSVQMGIMVES